jgi:lincosamide nucleotidyltransferase A/C/D/E
MTSSDVLDVYSSLEILRVEIWIDGGWGVDALGKQSRPHQDLDIAIQQKDLPILRELLRKRRYKEHKNRPGEGLEFRFGRRIRQRN